MLGLLLAKAGLQVTVLEKHADFLRDFRGDTVHPSTLEVLQELRIKERFDALPQQRVSQLKVLSANGLRPVVDFRGLSPFPYLSLIPQWDFLSFLSDEAQRYPGFELRMQTEVLTLKRSGQRVTGVIAQTPEGLLHVDSALVVGCDGRNSTVRAAAGLSPHVLGAPMDVLWFRLPRSPADPTDSFGVIGRGHFMALLQRGDYWQIAFVIAKGSASELRAQPIEALQRAVAQRVMFLHDRSVQLQSWEDVKLLEVRVDRLERWFCDGLLMLGDAAHAMSPIAGVGINLAVQDAVAAANLLSSPLAEGIVDLEDLCFVERRRKWPTKVTQRLQLLIQNRVISEVLGETDEAKPPLVLRLFDAIPPLRHIPGRLIGLGVRPEHIETPDIRQA